ASRAATAPSWGAGTSAKAPRYLPIGVRAAERIKASDMTASFCLATGRTTLISIISQGPIRTMRGPALTLPGAASGGGDGSFPICVPHRLWPCRPRAGRQLALLARAGRRWPLCGEKLAAPLDPHRQRPLEGAAPRRGQLDAGGLEGSRV